MEIGIVERAYELARECASVDEIRDKLRREGYSSVDAYVQGSLRTDLKKLMKSR